MMRRTEPPKAPPPPPSGRPNNNMEERVNFHGFPENDTIRSTVQAKLAGFRRMQIETQLQNFSSSLAPPLASSTTVVQPRPMNRFLKRGDSISSPGKVVSRTISEKLKPLLSPPVKTSPLNPIPVKVTVTPLSSPSLSEPKCVDVNSEDKTTTSVVQPLKFFPLPTTKEESVSVGQKMDRARRASAVAAVKETTKKLQRANPVKKRAARKSEDVPREQGEYLKGSVESTMASVALSIAAAEVKSIADEQAAPLLVANNSVVDEKEEVSKNARSDSDNRPESTQSKSKTDIDACLDKNVISDPEMPLLVNNNKDDTTINSEGKPTSKSNTVASTNKPPSPAKRAASVSAEFSFLPGQSVRSKRTIVPNKRFFSSDSPPPTLAKQLESGVNFNDVTLELPQQQQQNLLGSSSKVASKKSTVSVLPSSSSISSAKKRSVSGDSSNSGSGIRAKTVNRKRKLSAIETSPTTPTPNGSSHPLVEMSSDAGNARPRRTIIPNRKFLDEDDQSVVLKEPAVKKEVVEHKRKRRKSEKAVENATTTPISGQNHGLPPPPPPVQISRNTPVQTNGPFVSPVSVEKSGAKLNMSPDVSTAHQKKIFPILNGNSVPAALLTPKAADVKVEISMLPPPTVPEPIVEMKVDAKVPVATEVKIEDELAVTETEAAAYGKNPLFLGACILQSADLQNGLYSSGIICCGACGRLKKYRIVSEKRKRGSFLCAECVDIVQKIFQMAMKAKPFYCILGPPVCEGSCALVFSPPGQFCQACFAKSCLRNLPMKDDIYFKVWRAIPPMSRGCVPTTPSKNLTSPHVGKVAYVNDNGEIVSTTGSLKMFGGKKSNTATSGVVGVDATSEDSSSSSDVIMNGDGDLNSARIVTFSHRPGSTSTSNRENAVPSLKNSIGESQSTSSSSSSSSSSSVSATCTEQQYKETMKTTNGVTKEEMLLGRQIGQERVEAPVDSILKADLDDIEIFGFPIIVSGPSYPRKPLCFLCGSAGIEQLIYCSLCCEPYHPYCAGDDLLLNTYIASCNKDLDGQESSTNGAVDKGESFPLALKWTCRRCLWCTACGDCIGRKELIRCNRCQNAYHLAESCIDKKILAKVKNRSKLKKAWTCDVCMKCKSCGERIEPDRRLKTIQEVAATAKDSDGEEEEDEEEKEDEEGVPSSTTTNQHCQQQISSLMLCQKCFNQRKKGSFCPMCGVCYDDNDWNSKMMECCQCERWIHSTCENLSNEKYYILGSLPDDYICRLCHASSTNPPWYDALLTQLNKQCNSAITLFEIKALGSVLSRKRKRAPSRDIGIMVKPSYVCNLFGEDQQGNSSSSVDLDEMKNPIITLKVAKDDEPLDKAKLQEEKRLFRRNLERTVTYKEMASCQVIMTDFVKHPTTTEENMYRLKIMGVEVMADKVSLPNDENTDDDKTVQATPKEGSDDDNKTQAVPNEDNNDDDKRVQATPKEDNNDDDDKRVQTTPIHSTPIKNRVFTPSKQISKMTNSLKGMVGSITSLELFYKFLISTIEEYCESDAEKEILIAYARSALELTFTWFEGWWKELEEEEIQTEKKHNGNASHIIEQVASEKSQVCDRKSAITLDPFREVFWDYMDFFDDRICALCGEAGDFPPEQCGRLLWCGLSEWIHCNCGIWSSEVWELENGALQQVGAALNRGRSMRCKVCGEKGATVSCCHSTCKNSYHFKCAMEAGCFLLENKTMFCSHHKLTPKQLDNIQEDMKVGRKVFVDPEWIQKRGMKACSNDIRVFIGSLKIDNLGTIVPISVSPKTWVKTSDATTATLLVPQNFHSQRIFWSLNDPWTKECYKFQTTISSNGFHHDRTQDPGVNLIVDHSKNQVNIERGMETIREFHRWVKSAPRYIDEGLMEWLPPCSKEFHISDDEDDESGIDGLDVIHNNNQLVAMGRSSPSSVSSVGSIRKVPLKNRKCNNDNCPPPYSFRRRYDNKGEGDSATESVFTEGYASSVESGSSFKETPKSARTTKQMKRRRSSCKTRKVAMPRKRAKMCSSSSSKSKYESPRRRSMRNRFKDSANCNNFESWQETQDAYHPKEEENNDSDNDSGVTEGTSGGNCDDGTDDDGSSRCRINLLKKFNASFEKHNDAQMISEKIDECKKDDDPFGVMDSISLMSISSTLDEDGTSLSVAEESVSSQIPKCDDETLDVMKVYQASIQFDIQSKSTAAVTSFPSFDAKEAWMFLFNEVCKVRQSFNLEQLVHPTMSKSGNTRIEGTHEMELANSYRMLGVSHRAVQYLLEQLPGVFCVMNRHKFCHRSKPYVDPLDENALVEPNSTGSARSEGFVRRKQFDMFGWLASRHRKMSSASYISEESSRSQGLPLAMQFRDLKEKARKRFIVRHSEIHGRGLFACCDMEKGEMLIEYAGEVIRPSLSDPRERYYESKGIGCYMFRIKTHVIDATLKGNAARFINHSCEPNCEAKTVRILGMDHIIIFALRKIFQGEELTYDYKFEREESKITCSCGAQRCRKFMN